jgi:hypothetical protein
MGIGKRGFEMGVPLRKTGCTMGIRYFVTSDTKASKLLEKISEKTPLQFSHLDIHNTIGSFLGELF